MSKEKYDNAFIEGLDIDNSNELQNLKFNEVTWVDDINKANSNPTIFLANEFFDALPIKQFFKKKKDWFERFVDLKETHKDMTCSY